MVKLIKYMEKPRGTEFFLCITQWILGFPRDNNSVIIGTI